MAASIPPLAKTATEFEPPATETLKYYFLSRGDAAGCGSGDYSSLTAAQCPTASEW